MHCVHFFPKKGHRNGKFDWIEMRKCVHACVCVCVCVCVCAPASIRSSALWIQSIEKLLTQKHREIRVNEWGKFKTEPEMRVKEPKNTPTTQKFVWHKLIKKMKCKYNRLSWGEVNNNEREPNCFQLIYYYFGKLFLSNIPQKLRQKITNLITKWKEI